MKKKLLVTFLAATMAVSMMPVSASALTLNTESSQKANTAAEYVDNQVIVMYEEGAVTTEAPQATSEKAAAKRANKAKSFAMSTPEKSKAAKTEVQNTLGEQVLTLEQSLKDDYTIEDTIVFDGEEANQDKVISMISSEGLSTRELMEKLEKNDNVKYVEPNYIYEAADYNLNDARANASWQLNGEHGINAAEGWDAYAETVDKGSDSTQDVVVAVLDTGVDYTHEDLKNVMWTAPEGFKLEGKYGYDFINEDDDPMDEAGHGSHCAGIIAAQANNEVGIAGVARASEVTEKNGGKVKIMAIRILDATGTGRTYSTLKGLQYALRAKQQGVNVVAMNLSIGSRGAAYLIEDVLQEVEDENIIPVMAAGNYSQDIDHYYVTPASTVNDNAVVVAAADEDGTLASYSDYGKVNSDIAAPGTNILSSVCYDKYIPSTYDKKLIAETTRYYGEFDAESEANGFKPSLGKDVNGDAIQGVSTFDAPKIVSIKEDGSDGNAELSLDTSSRGSFIAAGNDTSLRVTIKNAKEGDKYYVYFPYNKETASENNTYFSLQLRGNVEESSVDGIQILYGDMIVKQGSDGNVSVDIAPESGGDVIGADADDTTESIWQSVGDDGSLFNYSEVSGLSSNADYGFGVAYSANCDGDASFDINSIAISKAGVDPEKFGKYDIYSGTSMATPVVTGTIGLLATMNPGATAHQLRDTLMQMTDDAFQDTVSSGGELDFSLYQGLVQGTKPALRSASVDFDNKKVTIEGSGFGENPKVKALFSKRDSEVELDPADVSIEDGRLVINDKYGLIGSYVTLKVDNGSKTGQGSFYLVKGEMAYTLNSDKIAEKMENPILFNDAIWMPSGNTLYGQDKHLGDIYVTRDGETLKMVGSTTTKAIKAYAQKKVKANPKSPWKTGKHDSDPQPFDKSNAVLVNGTVYELLGVDLGNREAVLLMGLNVCSSNPTWTIYSDTLTNYGNFADTGFGDLSDYTLTSYNGKLYIMGGMKESDGENIEINNRVFSTIPGKAGTVWEETASLPVGLYSGYAVESNGKLYYVLGKDSLEDVNYDVYAFDGVGWASVGNLPKAVDETKGLGTQNDGGFVPASVGIDTEGIIIGGRSFDGAGDTFRFNTKTNKVEQLGYTAFKGLSNQVSYGTSAGNRFYVMYFDMRSDRDVVKSIPISPAMQDAENPEEAEQKAFAASSMKMRSLKAYKGRKMKARWYTKKSVGGYQLQYSRSRSFSSKKTYGTKKVTIKGARSYYKYVRKLRAHKRYYVRVRAYKKIGGETIYTKWSGYKSVVAKK